jgi:hypothetical protein
MFQPRTLASGRICCSNRAALCAACRDHHGIHLDPSLAKGIDDLVSDMEERHMNSYAPPDPFAASLAALRAAATAAPESFEDRWKAERLRQLAAEQAALDEFVATAPRMTAAMEADLARFAPPNPYASVMNGSKR